MLSSAFELKGKYARIQQQHHICFFMAFVSVCGESFPAYDRFERHARMEDRGRFFPVFYDGHAFRRQAGGRRKCGF